MARLTKRVMKLNTYVNTQTQETLTLRISRVDSVFIVECDAEDYVPDYFDDFQDAMLQYGTNADMVLTKHHQLVEYLDQPLID